ncbi:MAG TPA: hypothetical protein VKQ30_11410 [Ktedonobacterales bacterium]|nr:hypothetical protein [Ktedonobacterales bacterium]
MQAAGTIFHLLGALRRAIGRVFLWFFLTGIVAAIVVEVVAYVADPTKSNYHPALLTNITAAVVGVALAYSAALTVLVSEVIRFIVGSAEKAEKEVKSDLSGGAKFLDSALQTIEHREKN